jgi:hypothetical protein
LYCQYNIKGAMHCSSLRSENKIYVQICTANSSPKRKKMLHNRQQLQVTTMHVKSSALV